MRLRQMRRLPLRRPTRCAGVVVTGPERRIARRNIEPAGAMVVVVVVIVSAMHACLLQKLTGLSMIALWAPSL
jgi:hypothetical protein